MAYRRHPFAPEEWYHCYTRGVDKRRTFESTRDYKRFIELLYLCNTAAPLHRDNLRNKSPEDIFLVPRTEPLVAIGVYCLMPNHFHILLQEKSDGGIARFMQKLGTAYTMYFNVRHERIGPLFVGPFRSKHISDDLYFRRVAHYIHLNPVELFEKDWKTSVARPRLATLEKRVRSYPYSSLADYTESSERPEKYILDASAVELIGALPTFSEILAEAETYYSELSLQQK